MANYSTTASTADPKITKKLGGLKNEISKMVMQQYTFGQIMAPREKAIAALLRLQVLGVKDEEIFNIYEWLNKIREKPLNNR